MADATLELVVDATRARRFVARLCEELKAGREPDVDAILAEGSFVRAVGEPPPYDENGARWQRPDVGTLRPNAAGDGLEVFRDGEWVDVRPSEPSAFARIGRAIDDTLMRGRLGAFALRAMGAVLGPVLVGVGIGAVVVLFQLGYHAIRNLAPW